MYVGFVMRVGQTDAEVELVIVLLLLAGVGSCVVSEPVACDKTVAIAVVPVQFSDVQIFKR